MCLASLRRCICRPALLAAWLWLLALPALALDPNRHAWEYTVHGWSTREGLPHNMIHDLQQDADGFLWIATWEGVVRFDGREFTVFDNGNIPGMETRAFRALALDRDGHLLAGSSRQGVWRRQGGRWIAPAGKAAGLWVTSLMLARDGSLWVGSERGPNQIDARGRLVRDAHTDQAGPNLWGQGFLQMPDGRILMATDAGLYEDIAGPEGPRHVTPDRGLPAGNARALLLRRDGSLLVAAQTGVYRRDGQRYLPVAQFVGKRVDALLEDRHGVLWANSSDEGLLRLANGQLEAIGPQMGVSGRGTSALFEDHEGLIWFGTTDGLFRVSDGQATTIDKLRGLSDNYVRTIIPARGGGMWIGSSGGLDRWRDGALQRIDRPWRGGQSSSVLALAEDAYALWVGSYDQSLLRVPHDGGPVTQIGPAQGLPARQVRSLLPSRAGGVWIGSVLGLYHRDRAGALTRIGGDSELGTGVVRALYEMPDGTLWVGTASGMARRSADGAVQHYDRKSRPAFPADSAFDFLADPDGTLWIGSDAGVVRLRNGRFTRYGALQGLPNESIFRILPGHGEDLWFTSNRGVFRIPRKQFDEIDAHRRQLLAVDVVDRSSGMRSEQANGNSNPAGAVAPDGQLWVPTAAGVAVIDPRGAGQHAIMRIPMVIESVTADGIAQRTDVPVLLDAGQARRVVIRFAGLNFREAGNLRYRYRMEGFDPDWVQAGSANEAIYTNLPSGPLRFRVQALVRPADWAHATHIDEAQLAFTLRPPFHRSGWFALLCVLGLLGAIALAWRLRNAAQLHRQRQLQGEVDARTQELRIKNAALEHAAEERQRLMEQLSTQASHDELTGLPNRRALNAALAEVCASARPCQVALVDADHFKRINDTHGHDVGDAVLQHLAQLMQQTLDDHGLCARWGGEEFALMLPDMTHAQALALCEAVRARADQHPYRFEDGRQLGCTVSIGLSGCHIGANPHRLLREADQQAYRAKAEGRNRVCAAG